jgi:outer membrane protein TolC
MNHPFCSHSILLTALVQTLWHLHAYWGPGVCFSRKGYTDGAGEKSQHRSGTCPMENGLSANSARSRLGRSEAEFPIALGPVRRSSGERFTNQTVSLEQSIPISGRNRSRERAAAAEAVAAFQDLRRQELEVVAKARSAFIQLVSHYDLLDLNQAEETALSQIIESNRAKFEVGAQPESDLLEAQIEQQKSTEKRQNLEQQRSVEETALKVLLNLDAFQPLGRTDSASSAR